MAIEINENVTADGQTAEIDWPGGPGTLSSHGTPDSATVTLQSSLDEGITWQDVEDGSLTVELVDKAGDKGFSLTARKLRVNVSGGGGSMDLNILVKPDRREFVGTVA